MGRSRGNSGSDRNPPRPTINRHRADVKGQLKEYPLTQHTVTHSSTDFNKCFISKVIKTLPPNYNHSQQTKKVGTVLPIPPAGS